MSARFGAEVVPLILHCCCGNIYAWHPFDPDADPDHRRMGCSLAVMAERLTHGMVFGQPEILRSHAELLHLSYRDIPEISRQEVADILAANPQPPRDKNGQVDPRWFIAASTRSIELCLLKEPQFPYDIQVCRVGNLATVGLPGEPFLEGQVAIKTNSAAPYVFAAHAVNNYVGYLPTREASQRGGHETNKEVTYWAKLAPGSLETAVQRASEILRQLFA